jgi:hypothetical protein
LPWSGAFSLGRNFVPLGTFAARLQQRKSAASPVQRRQKRLLRRVVPKEDAIGNRHLALRKGTPATRWGTFFSWCKPRSSNANPGPGDEMPYGLRHQHFARPGERGNTRAEAAPTICGQTSFTTFLLFPEWKLGG